MKWNVIDRVSTQILYAVTGIVLARELSQEDFGLVGVLLIFQAFASLLVDSGFSHALIQRKSPTRLDYSTVLWFNLGVAALMYVILYACAPLIAHFFQDDMRLVPLSRLMFVAIILNASSIVQVNRQMKLMDVRIVAVANSLALALGGIAGITLAVCGYGAWAIVWQTIVHSGAKSLILWTGCRWWPVMKFSWAALASFFNVGSRMMLAGFMSAVFQYIYSFFIGHRVGLTSLGYYTQADKWSKMGITALTQVMSSSFLPALSAVQDDRPRFANMVSRMNRFTAYLLFPAMIGLAVMATPIFHVLFGTKWDPSIVLFRLLLVRGIFYVLNQLYNNYLLALGLAKEILWLEILRDVAAAAALVASLPFMAMTLPDDPVYGITLLLWGQLGATVLTWIATVMVTARCTGLGLGRFLLDLAPYTALTFVIVPLMVAGGYMFSSDVVTLVVEIAIGAGLYLGANYLLGSRIQREVIGFLRGKGLG